MGEFMTRKDELLEVCYKDYYMYGSVMHSILEKDILDGYINQITDDQLLVKGSCIFKTDYITHSELFIYNLDRFIYFFKHKLIIEEGESRYILELILNSKFSKILLEKTFCFDNDYINHYNLEYKKILCDNFYKNIKCLKASFKEFFAKEQIDVEQKKLSGKNLEKVYKLLCGMVNCKRSDVHYLFADVDDWSNHDAKINYYVLMWEGLIKEYESKYIYLTKLEI